MQTTLPTVVYLTSRTLFMPGMGHMPAIPAHSGDMEDKDFEPTLNYIVRPFFKINKRTVLVYIVVYLINICRTIELIWLN